MLRGNDHLGPVLRRAFRRVDGVTMYVFIAAWLLRPVVQWVIGNWHGLAFNLPAGRERADLRLYDLWHEATSRLFERGFP